MGRTIAALCALAFLASAGCTSMDRTGAIKATDSPRTGEEHARANHMGPEGEREALPVRLTLPTPPRYPVLRVPSRPQVIGRLDVPLKREWRYVVIHHSYSESGSEAIFDRYHREVRGWKGVGYDFVIGNGHGSPDGAIEVTFRWEQQIAGAHAGDEEYNEHGIGICLVGDFESSYPTQKQMESLVALVSYLQVKCHIPAHHIVGHRHVKNTKCPGENFPYYRFLSLLPH